MGYKPGHVMEGDPALFDGDVDHRVSNSDAKVPCVFLGRPPRRVTFVIALSAQRRDPGDFI